MNNILLNVFIFLIGIAIGFGIQTFNTSIIQQPIKEDKKTIHSNTKTLKIKKETIKPLNTQKIQTNIPNKKSVTKEKKEITSIEKFKQLLLNHEYENALMLYEQKSNNDTLLQYDKILFNFIEQELLKNNLKIKKLIESFLQIYYENPQALYYLNVLMYKQKEYKQSIDILYKIKDLYISKETKNKIKKELETNISLYLTALNKLNDTQKTFDFLVYLIDKEPQNTLYKYTLAKLYFNLKHYEKSKNLFEEIYYDGLYQNSIAKYIESINKKIKIRAKFKQKIPLQREGNHFYINATINENIKVKLLIDTGATITLINAHLFKNLDLTTFKTINLSTANGIVKAYITKVEKFSINNLSFDNFEISISKLNKELDGLLGMNYLKNFDFYIDQDDSILYLNPL